MRQMTLIFSLGCLFVSAGEAEARYGEKLCHESGYKCVKVKKRQSWGSLFPNAKKRDLVMRINRMNTRLHTGTVIAVPKDLDGMDLMDAAPFPEQIDMQSRKLIVVDQGQLAWGAYSRSGKLLNWGPMSGGRGFCKDIGEKCQTPAGQFTVFRKEGVDCESSTFPVGKGGAPMPYCAFFNGGIAFHGSSEVPGYNASHGCVRMYTKDAEWLNTEFIELGKTRVLVDTDLPKKHSFSIFSSSSKESSSHSFANNAGRVRGGVDTFPWH